MAEGLDGALVQEAAGAHRGHHPRTAGIKDVFSGRRSRPFLMRAAVDGARKRIYNINMIIRRKRGGRSVKKLNYRELGVSSAAILLLSLVLAALPFTQNLSENTLRIGVPFPFFTVRITALGALSTLMEAGGLLLDCAIAYAVLIAVKRLRAAVRKK